MAKTRINWIEAKSRYLTGNIDDVSEFMSVVYGFTNRSGQRQLKTRGWPEERRDYQLRLAERREEALINSPLFEDNAEKLLKAENKIMDIVFNNLSQLEEMIEFDQRGTPIINRNAQGLRTLWEMIRISQNKHINGTKNENINKNLNFSLKDLVDEKTTKNK